MSSLPKIYTVVTIEILDETQMITGTQMYENKLVGAENEDL